MVLVFKGKGFYFFVYFFSSVGEWGGFNKFGGFMDEGLDFDLGLFVDLDEDFDNSVIYV